MSNHETSSAAPQESCVTIVDNPRSSSVSTGGMTMRDLNIEELGHVYGAGGQSQPCNGQGNNENSKDNRENSKQHNQQEASKSKSKEKCNFNPCTN